MMAMFRSFVSASTQLRQQPQPQQQQQQPGSGSCSPAEGIESQFSCPICLEVYHKPVSIASCAHTFCGECLQPCLQVTSPLCPLCRVPFDPKKVERSSSVEKQLASYKAPCRGCSKKVSLVKMRSHIASCSKVQEQIANCPNNIPNRSTFVCPFCGARHLDQQELVKHCMDNHRNDPNKVLVAPDKRQTRARDVRLRAFNVGFKHKRVHGPRLSSFLLDTRDDRRVTLRRIEEKGLGLLIYCFRQIAEKRLHTVCAYQEESNVPPYLFHMQIHGSE
ncbi:hypothetical protein F2P81_020495 [Scophthalmus maximus]|uniref:E3 ubiquitin-protein ligase RNF166 n=1 Tax=Scophthalmus maximus TaxID=52904 RepID=A0A6A4SAH1_SCOMX|nr:hypothetical protein F2P81_020495 [Scophthalmus maximus]